MSEEQSDWVTDLWDDLTVHWKKVVVVIVVALVAGTILIWRKDKAEAAELAATHEVWQMQMSNTVAATQWERVATAHDGTTAGARALLLAAETYFLEGQRGLAVVSRAETDAMNAKEAATRTLKEAREEVKGLKETWDDLKAAAEKAEMQSKKLGKDPKTKKEDKDKAVKEAADAKAAAETAKANHEKAVEDRLEVASQQLEQSEQDIESGMKQRQDAVIAAKSAFSSAQQRFEQFLGDHGMEHPFSGTALLGKAACLDELGDPGALDAYQAVLNDFGQEMVAIQAKLALASLYEESGKYADAKKLLDDVQKTDLSQFWGRQAEVLRGRLLDKRPELKGTSTATQTNLPEPISGSESTNGSSTNSTAPAPSTNQPPAK